QFYHSGHTDDLDHVVGLLLERDADAPIGVVGVSLGGNVLLKWLGERELDAPKQVVGAVAISAPLRLVPCARVLDRGLRKYVYTASFLTYMRDKVRRKAERDPDFAILVDLELALRARTFGEYDRAVTARLHGVADDHDYWATASSAALETYGRAVDGLLGWDAEALDRFGAAATTEPGLALAHAGLAICQFLDERFVEARESAKRARTAASTQTPRERGHVEAIALLVEGKAHDAEAAMTRHLADFPRDLVVFQRLYFVWFRNHLLWHLILMHLGRGEYERASGLGRTVFEREPSSIPGDLHDSISLLWRLELCGLPVKDRWRPFAAIAAGRLDRQPLLFHSAHLAMALAAGGDWATAERQLGMLRERAARDRPGLAG